MSQQFPELESFYFHLSTKILYDTFADSSLDILSYNESDELQLDGVRVYQPKHILHDNYIYVILASQCSEILAAYPKICFLVAGTADLSCFHPDATVLMVGKESDFPAIINLAQQTFEKYSAWDLELHLAINSDTPLEDMLSASLDIFHNPIFVHDINFYILACPRQVPGMAAFERDPRTGKQMLSLSLIHDYKVDPEYIRTLSTVGADFYTRDQSGHRILYRNIRNQENYEGRICIDELQSTLLPGMYEALDYLGTLIELCIVNRNLFHSDTGYDARKFMEEYIGETLPNLAKVQDFLSFQGWQEHDSYVCLRLEASENYEQLHSAQATLGHIEMQVPSGCAFMHEQGIVVCVNLSYKGTSIPEVISGLAILLREGLFKLGASSEFSDFLYFRQAYIQASAALRFGSQSDSTAWCYRFEDHMLDYVYSRSTEELSPLMLCSPKIQVLMQYDKENHTELCRTLQTYLTLERNVLQTAKALFIHRSTLFYRLERIAKIGHINTDDFKERMSLLFSFAIMDIKKPED